MTALSIIGWNIVDRLQPHPPHGHRHQKMSLVTLTGATVVDLAPTLLSLLYMLKCHMPQYTIDRPISVISLNCQTPNSHLRKDTLHPILISEHPTPSECPTVPPPPPNNSFTSLLIIIMVMAVAHQYISKAHISLKYNRGKPTHCQIPGKDLDMMRRTLQ